MVWPREFVVAGSIRCVNRAFFALLYIKEERMRSQSILRRHHYCCH